MLRVRLEPENRTLELPQANTVLQLLNRLERKPGRALVIRDGGLLTPDVKLRHGDELVVRDVVSRG